MRAAWGLFTMVLLAAVPACSRSDGAVSLRWNPPSTGVLGFVAWQGEPSPDAPTIDVEALADGRAPTPAELKVPAQPAAPRLAFIGERQGDKLVVQTVVLPEAGSRDAAAGKDGDTGVLQDWVELNLDGTLASFWKPQRARNLFAILFELPKHPVQVGDSWPLGVNLLEVNVGPARPKKAARTDRVRLISLKPEGDDVLATIEYVIAETFLSAETPGKTEPVTKLAMAFVGRGEFFVHHGHWKALSGWMTFQGNAPIETQTSFLGLRFISPLPPAFTKPVLAAH